MVNKIAFCQFASEIFSLYNVVGIDYRAKTNI